VGENSIIKEEAMERMEFQKKTVRDVDVNDTTVLVRADYNVPLSDAGEITDDLRIRASLPTLQYLLEHDARKVVVISHLGRPDGKVVGAMSLAPVAGRLAELLPGVEVNFVPYTTGTEVEQAVQSMDERGVLLLENLRFDPGEEADSDTFAAAIVAAVQPAVFVQDGFGVVHRAHASTDAICRLVPSVAGLLLEKEIVNLLAAREPESPSVAMIGGAKVEDKAPLIEKLAAVYDVVYVGGKIANEWSPAPELTNVVMPSDYVDGEDGTAWDIGAESTATIVEGLEGAATVLWNGTLGWAEKPKYAAASEAVARAMGGLTRSTEGGASGNGEGFGETSATTIVAGGDTTAFVEQYQAEHPEAQYSLISTGGGAALEFLLGEKLPGVEALEER
jgi:phosphoglycerate kinase